jgi:hypothetical protein
LSDHDIWIVRAEGVNFDATLTDTEDLSIRRGASLALLRIEDYVADVLKDILPAEKVPERPVFAGASQCVFEIAGPLPFDDLDRRLQEASETRLRGLRSEQSRKAGDKTKSAPFHHLCLVIDAVKTKGSGEDAQQDAIARAEAKNRSRQMRSWSLPPIGRFEPGINRLDRFDRLRPGVAHLYAPLGKGATDQADPERQPPPLLAPVTRDRDRKLEVLAVSASSKARREYGSDLRRSLYERELFGHHGDGAPADARAAWAADPLLSGLSVTDSLEELVLEPPERLPAGEALPVSLKGKIAVIYADGNRFGDVRKKVGTAEFSAQLKEKRRALLDALVRWFAENHASADPCSPKTGSTPFAIESPDRKVNAQVDFNLRLETLLWGGDEFTFVVPAWLAMEVLGLITAQTVGWEIGGQRLTHSVGAVFADRKVPIRILHERAKEIADIAKDAGLRQEDSVTIEAFESIAPPELSIKRTRAAQFGPLRASDETESALPTHKELARMLALPSADWPELTARFDLLKNGLADGDKKGFARSQLYKALQSTWTRGGLFRPPPDTDTDTGTESPEKLMDAYFGGYGARSGYAPADLKLPSVFEDGSSAGESERRPLSIDLVLLTELWDYTALGFANAGVPNREASA